VQRCDLRVAVAAPLGPLPPLRPRVHVRVVQRRIAIDAYEPAAGLAQPHAQLVVLGGDHLRVVATHAIERAGPDHHVPAEVGGLTDRAAAPFHVADPVEHRLLDVTLPSPAAHRNHIGVAVQHLGRRVDPPVDDLTVPVDELNELHRGVLGHQALEAGVACPRGRERDRHVEIDDGRSALERCLGAPVGGRRVHVDHRPTVGRHRFERLDQPLALVAPDQDDPDPRVDPSLVARLAAVVHD